MGIRVQGGDDGFVLSGNKDAKAGRANPWGFKNMYSGAREWCYDWYGEYAQGEQVDPVGRDYGLTRVVRGGYLDDGSRNRVRKIFDTSSTRASSHRASGFIMRANNRSRSRRRTNL